MAESNSTTKQIVAEKIQKNILLSQEMVDESTPIVSASIGIGYSENKKIHYQNLLSAADEACYDAKRTTKGTVKTRRMI